MRHWLEVAQQMGPAGLAVFCAVFLIVSLSLLPTVELYVGAGLLYGAVWGTVLVTALGVLAELCTYLIVHSSLRKWIEPRIQRNEKLRALDRAFRDRTLSILFLLRLSPIIPFGPLNYALAMTKVPLWKRVVTNVAGTLPGTIVLVYAGSYLSNVAELSNVQTPSLWKHIAIWGGIAISIAASVLAARATRKALREHRC